MKEKKIAYSIGEMADFFGVSRDTLRLYDKMGIISPSKNSNNGYRVYSRADFICLDYIMRLKKLGMPLEDIKMMINDCSIETAEAIMQVQEQLITEKIEELKSLKLMVRDYQKSFREAIIQMGHITVETSPLMIYKEVEYSMKDTMAAFNELTKEYVPKFTFVLDKDSFLDTELDFYDTKTRNSMMEYALTMIDDEAISRKEDFPYGKFDIIKPRKCVKAIMKFYTNRDYGDLNRLRDYIIDNNYELCGPILLRTISIRNNKELNVDYYEAWAPIL